MPKRKIAEIYSAKKAKIEPYGYQTLAVAQMIDLEEDAHEVSIDGETVKIRREIGALTLPAGSGKTLVCLGRLLRWLDEPQSNVAEIPLAFNALMFSPRNANRAILSGRNVLFPQRLDGEVSTYGWDYGRQAAEKLMEEKKRLSTEDRTASYYLRMESIARRFYQSQTKTNASMFGRGDWNTFRAELFDGYWGPEDWPTSAMPFGKARSFTDSVDNAETLLQDILSNRHDSNYSLKHLPKVMLSPRAGGFVTNSCLVIAPPPVLKQWRSCVENLPSGKWERFVFVERSAELLNERLEKLGGLYGAEKRVYLVPTLHKQPATTTYSRNMSPIKYITHKPHDLIIQDEFHLFKKNCLPLSYNFLWAVSATAPTQPRQPETANTFARVLTAAVVRARWVAGLDKIFPEKPHLRDQADKSHFQAASGADFLVDTMEVDTTLDVWGLNSLRDFLLDKNLTDIVEIAPTPTEYLALPEPSDHTIVYRKPACLLNNTADELACVAFAPAEQKKAIYREVSNKAYQTRLFAKVGSLVPNSPNFSSYRALAHLAAGCRLTPGNGLSRLDVEMWKSTSTTVRSKAETGLERLNELASKFRAEGMQVGPSDHTQVAPLASALLSAVDRAADEIFESTFKDKFDRGCGVCLDDEVDTLLTCCCRQATCSTCAARIEAKCPYCRADWAATRATCAKLAERIQADTRTGTLTAVLHNLVLKILAKDPPAKILIVCSLNPDTVVAEMLPPGILAQYCIRTPSARFLDEFRSKASVLVLNERVLNYGVNFQFVDHLIIMDGVPERSLPQIIGRVQRLGRVKPAQIYYLKEEGHSAKEGLPSSSFAV